MGQITDPLPAIGERNKFADPKVLNLLASLKTLVNGHIQADNLSAGVLDVPAYGDWLQPGVVGASDLKVAPSTGMGVSVEAGTAWVMSTGQVLTRGRRPATTTMTLSNGHATLPRVDRISISLAAPSALNFSILGGVATAGATLNNLSGAQAVPAGELLLADILIPPAAAAIGSATIRDRRPRARGQFFTQTVTGTTLTINDASDPLLNGHQIASQLTRRFEAGVGSSFLITLRIGRMTTNNPTDIAFVENLPASGALADQQPTQVPDDYDGPLTLTMHWAPAAGSYLLAPVWLRTAGGSSASIITGAGPGRPMQYTVMEIVRPSADNGTV